MLKAEIEKAYSGLMKVIKPLSPSQRQLKVIHGTGGKVSVADLIAYQIGWGKSLLRWYEAGVEGKKPEMPAEGFTTWDYTSLAKHFYTKYHYDGGLKQEKIFEELVYKILGIVEQEGSRLDETGIYEWCTLPSGKEWTLAKWIRVNTSSPYKRAKMLISRSFPQDSC